MFIPSFPPETLADVVVDFVLAFFVLLAAILTAAFYADKKLSDLDRFC